LQRGIVVGSDFYLLDALSTLFRLGLRPEAARPLFSDPAVAKRFPLSYARLLIEEKKTDEAQSWLGQAKPDRVPEKIYHCFLVLFSDPRAGQQAFFDDWSRQNFSEFSQWVLNESLDGIERVLVYEPISEVQLYAEFVESRYAQSWLVLFEQFKDRMAADKFAQNYLNIFGHQYKIARRSLQVDGRKAAAPPAKKIAAKMGRRLQGN
jgi:hypothetical protein